MYNNIDCLAAAYKVRERNGETLSEVQGGDKTRNYVVVTHNLVICYRTQLEGDTLQTITGLQNTTAAS